MHHGVREDHRHLAQAFLLGVLMRGVSRDHRGHLPEREEDRDGLSERRLQGGGAKVAGEVGRADVGVDLET